MNKIKFINIFKPNASDYDKIKELPINIVYRYLLKLMRTYPSTTRDAVRESLILDFQENKTLTDTNKINDQIGQARGFLHHVLTYEIVRHEMDRVDTNKFTYNPPSILPNHQGVSTESAEEVKKREEKEYEFF